jgi:hypothetical protein
MLSMQAYRRRTMTLKTGSGIGFREVLMMQSEWWEEACDEGRVRVDSRGSTRRVLMTASVGAGKTLTGVLAIQRLLAVAKELETTTGAAYGAIGKRLG